MVRCRTARLRCLVELRSTFLLLVLTSVGLGCRQFRRADADGSDEVRATLERSRVRDARAGLVPARVKGGEFGIIDAARMSPDGRWIAVSDESSPYVKVVNDSGVTTAAIDLAPGVQGQQLTWPVIAISNHDLLVIRPELRRVERYGFDGSARGVFDGLDFVPITATAITDSTWMLYGPSDTKTDSGATWVHCLYLESPSRVFWRNALVDRVDSISGATTNSAAPYVSGSSVIVEHRQRHGAILVSIDCGTGHRDAEPTLSIEAHAIRGRSDGSTPTYRELSGVGGASITRLGGALWTVSTDSTAAVTFQRVGRGSSNFAIRFQVTIG